MLTIKPNSNLVRDGISVTQPLFQNNINSHALRKFRKIIKHPICSIRKSFLEGRAPYLTWARKEKRYTN